MKINDYESTTTLTDNDNFVVQTTAGTRKVSASLVDNKANAEAIAENTEAIEGLSGRVEVLENTIEKQGNWTIQKFNDGRLYQTYRGDVTLGSWAAWGNIYESRMFETTNFPVSYIDKPSLVVNIPDLATLGTEMRYDRQKIISLYALRPNTNVPSSNYDIVIEARGFWK